MPPQETHYVWKEWVTVKGEDSPRLITPWANSPYPFDYLCKNPEHAYEVLDMFGGKDDAIDVGWILCKVTLTPLKRAGCTNTL